MEGEKTMVAVDQPQKGMLKEMIEEQAKTIEFGSDMISQIDNITGDICNWFSNNFGFEPEYILRKEEGRADSPELQKFVTITMLKNNQNDLSSVLKELDRVKNNLRKISQSLGKIA